MAFAHVIGQYRRSRGAKHPYDYARTPHLIGRNLGRYDVRVFRLGRLAVDRTRQGVGLGGQLLVAAAQRCIAASEIVGGVAIVIDAKSPRAAAWYARFGSIPLNDAPMTMMLPLATFKNAILPSETKPKQ